MKIHAVFGLLALSTWFAGCVVESSDSNSDEGCSPGNQRSCKCGSQSGNQTCNSDGDGFSTCDCSGSGTGGSSPGSGGSGTGGSSDDEDAAASGGTTSEGGPGTGGASTGGAAADGGEPDATAADDGGAGDAAPDAPVVNFTDECLACAQVVCEDELDACALSDVCFPEADSGELVCMLDCMNLDREASDRGFVGVAAVEECGTVVCATQGAGWPNGVDPTTSDLVDCLAGRPDWFQQDAWQTPAVSNCTNECFGAGG
jgi:hypothetical protein